MENAETILVIYLSVALGVFLILGIIFLVKAIMLANKFNRLADKAERAVETAQSVAGSLSIGRFVGRMADFVSRFKDDNKGKG